MESSEVQVSHAGVTAEELVSSTNSLNEQLGSDWRQRSIKQSVADVFSPEQLQAIQNRKTPEQGNIHTPIEIWVDHANSGFEETHSPYRASVVMDGDRQKAYLEGNIGPDGIYVLASQVAEISLKNRTIIGILAEKVGLISPDGKVFGVDQLINNNSTEIMFHAQTTGEGENTFVSCGDTTDTVVSILPKTTNEVGELFHEIGHTIRSNMRRKRNQTKAFHEAHVKFKEPEQRRGLSTHTGEGFSAEEVRKIKVAEERGAWATGISIIREVGKLIGLETSSSESIHENIKDADKWLSTYDLYPYEVTTQTEGRRIPAFARESRKAAWELLRKLKGKGVSYADLPNFDEKTGIPIGNNPKVLIEYAEKQSGVQTQSLQN